MIKTYTAIYKIYYVLYVYIIYIIYYIKNIRHKTYIRNIYRTRIYDNLRHHQPDSMGFS